MYTSHKHTCTAANKASYLSRVKPYTQQVPYFGPQPRTSTQSNKMFNNQLDYLTNLRHRKPNSTQSDLSKELVSSNPIPIPNPHEVTPAQQHPVLAQVTPQSQSTIILSQYTSITLPFQIVFNDGWPSMSLYIEKGLMKK